MLPFNVAFPVLLVLYAAYAASAIWVGVDSIRSFRSKRPYVWPASRLARVYDFSVVWTLMMVAFAIPFTAALFVSRSAGVALGTVGLAALPRLEDIYLRIGGRGPAAMARALGPAWPAFLAIHMLILLWFACACLRL